MLVDKIWPQFAFNIVLGIIDIAATTTTIKKERNYIREKQWKTNANAIDLPAKTMNEWASNWDWKIYGRMIEWVECKEGEGEAR